MLKKYDAIQEVLKHPRDQDYSIHDKISFLLWLGETRKVFVILLETLVVQKLDERLLVVEGATQIPNGAGEVHCKGGIFIIYIYTLFHFFSG